jgi:ribonuclease HI
MENASLTKELIDQEAQLQQCYHKACLAEEEYWRLKSRNLWLKAGDRNTAFFHKQAQVRKCFNTISEIKVDRDTHNDFDHIKKAAFSHFQDLYREDKDPNQYPDLLDIIPTVLSQRMKEKLEAKVTKDEVKKALFDMDPDKAPGPDGFSARFLQACWQIVEKDLLKMVQKSQNTQRIGGSTNSAFLALLPKEKGANNFSRFRPISLCNIGYKIITKVIANRLKCILPKIIPENQGGFIQGRQIVDNYILVQEAIHSSLRRKEQGMVVKLDLANAFDRVNHSFLLNVMSKFGFGENFIKWIRACISEPWIAPLVNGRATDFFKASRGLRQGCPLSPLLFVIQASVLSFLLDKKMQDQDINGLCIARGVKNINHALFADDTLLLGAASLSSAYKFKAVLDEFSEASGSVINKSKCHIYSWNTTPRLLSDISRCLGFAASSSWSSFKYLGLPVTYKRPASKDWLPQLEKFKSKIQAWGYSWLNSAGKSVLIKSVLTSLPLFQFVGLLAPVTILKKMEEYIRRFFWKGGKQNENKIPLVSWETISKPVCEGGLNFKNLCQQNVAMAAKIIWKIIAPKPGWAQLALWKKYFRGPRSRCLEQVTQMPNSAFLKLYAKAAPLITTHSYWIPGNGKKINIWTDKIMNKAPIEDRASIRSLRCWMDRKGLRSLWDISCWNNSDWAGWKPIEVPDHLTTEWTTLLELLHGLAPTHMRKKDWKGWGPNARGYVVSLGYAKLNERPYAPPPPPPDPAPWQGVWRFPSWPKIDFFAWLFCHGKILTYDYLQKKGFYGPSICSLCNDNTETTVHLILECSFSKQIWSFFVQDVDPNFVLPRSTAELFSKWAIRYPGPPPKNQIIKAAWAVLPKVICWQIWLERNRRVFRNAKQNPKALEIRIKDQLKECLIDIKDDSNLSQQDIAWGSTLDIRFTPTVRKAPTIKEWQIRKSETDFQDWLKTQARHSLFFDGAAKGNPGKAGAGGVVVNPFGDKIHSYAWGLGYSSSIQAEALALFQGLKILKDLNIKEANVIGDSQIIINAMVSNSPASDLKLSRLIIRIKGLGNYFQNLRYYHVLRIHNKEADIEANKAALLSAGVKMKDEEESWEPIP